jgi:hypothetical protein
MTNKLYRVYLNVRNGVLKFEIKELTMFSEKKVIWTNGNTRIKKEDLGFIYVSSFPFSLNFDTYCLEDQIGKVKVEMIEKANKKLLETREKMRQMENLMKDCDINTIGVIYMEDSVEKTFSPFL